MSAPTFPDVFNLADYFLFDRLGEGLGASTAVRFGDRSYSYDLVAARALSFAAVLRDGGLRHEERVLLILPDVPPFAWCFFGALKAGGVIAMGNPDAPTDSLEHIVEYTRASFVVTVPRVAEALTEALRQSPFTRGVLVVPDCATGDDPEGECAAPPVPGLRVEPLAQAIAFSDRMKRAPVIPPTRRDDLAIWLFTSGSTGKPKAAVHTHRDFAFNTEVYALGTVGYRRGDVCVSVPRLFFGYATGTNLMFPFRAGATAALFSERPTPESLTAAIARYRPTVLTNVPTMIGKLLEDDAQRRERGEPGLDLSSLRFCLSAGEALPPSLLARWTERFGVDVYDGIGSAEMFHIYVTNRPGDIKPGSLGRVVEGYEVRVLPSDAEGPGAQALAHGEVGTLWVRGESVALCYWEDRDKSWQTFHGRWCCTSDLFYLDAEGYLYFAGRADDLVKVSGQWVSPLEVEDCLLAHPAVAEVAVVGVLVEGLMSTRAHVVAREGVACDDALARALQEHVKARLAWHKYPRAVVFERELPKSDRGKIDRKTLKARG
ncbi:MAG: benzoate-CoA ligase family protein [Polyangiales bacterium]